MGTNLSKGNSFAHLPDHLDANIISLLPIQSIVRCRTVCKAWLRLISGIDFKCLYQKRGMNNTYMTFITYSPSSYNLFELNVKDRTFRSVEPVKPVKLSYDFGPRTGMLSLVGCCNGLICMVENLHLVSFFYIWNPILGEYISASNPRKIKRSVEYYGFGYCPNIREYKVLKAERGNGDLEVITIAPNSTTWRSLWKPCCKPLKWYNFHYLNGVIHWICHCRDETKPDWILGLDCETEQRLVLQPPRDCSLIHSSQLVSLVVLRNRLCLIHFFIDEIVLWTMEDYGVAESWIKQTCHNQFGASYIISPAPLLLREDKEILFLGPGAVLCYYNYDRKQYVNTRTTLESYWKPNGFSYIPSFVPLLEVFKDIPLKMPIRIHSASGKPNNFVIKLVKFVNAEYSFF